MVVVVAEVGSGGGVGNQLVYIITGTLFWYCDLRVRI